MKWHKSYGCTTCNMTGNVDANSIYVICEICIKNCHVGHNISEMSFERGFCDCGEEGSRGIRSCKMLTGKFIHEFVSFCLLNLSITFFNYWITYVCEKIGFLMVSPFFTSCFHKISITLEMTVKRAGLKLYSYLAWGNSNS